MMRRIILLFISWKVLLLIFAIIAAHFVPLNQKSWLGFFHASVALPYPFWIWANSDGVNYLDIARSGYHYPNYAFFPLLPFLIFLVNDFLFLPNTISGLLISNIAAFLSFAMLYKITMLDFDKKIAWRTVLTLAVFPVSFYLGALYADSLFLVLSLTSFYFARKSKWLLAGIFVYFATLTRLVGGILFLALLVEWFLQQKARNKESIKTLVKNFLRQRAYYLFLGPLGLVTFMAYLQIQSGDFLLFQKAMAHWSQSETVFPPQVVFRYIKIFLFAAKDTVIYYVAILEFIAVFAYTFLSLYVLKKIRISYGLLMLGIFLLPTFTGTFQGMPRYILHAFPAFIALALLPKRSKKLFWGFIVISLILQAIFVALFTRGYFVA